jgi:hypothetical protein
MKALIEHSLYRPTIVLAILSLVRLMTAVDFSVTQIVFVLAFRGTRYVLNAIIQRAHASLVVSSRTATKTAARATPTCAPR